MKYDGRVAGAFERHVRFMQHAGSRIAMGAALLAKHMGKVKLTAETGVGQHGVALVKAAAYLGLECEIHMGDECPQCRREIFVGSISLFGHVEAYTLQYPSRGLKRSDV